MIIPKMEETWIEDSEVAIFFDLHGGILKDSEKSFIENKKIEIFKSSFFRKRPDVIEELVKIYPEENFFGNREEIIFFSQNSYGIEIGKAILDSNNLMMEDYQFWVFQSALASCRHDIIESMIRNEKFRNKVSLCQKDKNNLNYSFTVYEASRIRDFQTFEIINEFFPEFYQNLYNNCIICKDEIAIKLIANNLGNKISLLKVSYDFICENRDYIGVNKIIDDKVSRTWYVDIINYLKALVVTPEHKLVPDDILEIFNMFWLNKDAEKYMLEIRAIIDRFVGKEKETVEKHIKFFFDTLFGNQLEEFFFSYEILCDDFYDKYPCEDKNLFSLIVNLPGYTGKKIS